jgi:DNA helicase-2/ATP-dependent DNA helicase PcrA
MPIELPYIRKFMKDLVKFLDPLMEDASSLEPAEVIALLRNSLDYDRVCTEEDLPSPDDVKIQNINEFQLAATKFTDLQSFLDYTDTFQDELVHDKDGVSLMTIHKAKGLQFPVVFVVGMVEGIMPPKKADIEEERRVCFVSISRAMKLLYLSYSHNHLGQPAKKSIFLDEILGIKDKETPS